MVSQVLIKEIAQSTREGIKQAGLFSQDTFRFDFVSLILKIFIFFAIGYTINKIMEAIIGGDNFIRSVAGLVGVNFPEVMPKAVVNFWTSGFQTGAITVKFWDIVKVIAVLFVAMELMMYIENEKNNKRKPNPSTLAVFGILIVSLSLITFPELFTRIQEIRAMNRTVSQANPDERSFRAGR